MKPQRRRSQQTKRVLVIEGHAADSPHPSLRGGGLLPRPHWRLKFAASLDEAFGAIDLSLDLLLLDFWLLHRAPRGAMVELQALCGRAEGVPVAVLSQDESPTLIHDCFVMGASAFIPRRLDPVQLPEAVASLLAGLICVPRSLAAAFALASRRGEYARTPLRPFSKLKLTPRQHSVLALLLEGRSNKEIAQALKLSVGTVKNYVSEILRSMNANTRSRVLAKLRFSTPGSNGQ